MHKVTLLKISFPLAAVLATAGAASAQTVVYTETFDPAPVPFIEFNLQLGGDPALRPLNTRIVQPGEWVLTSNGAIVDIGGDHGNVLQPQLDDRNNGRLAGVFLSPSLFASTGAGTYTLTFDVIAGSSSGAGRVYVGAGSGYDSTGTTNAKLNLNISTAGFGVARPSGQPAWAALTASGGATASHLVTTSTQWILADGTETGEFRDAPGAPFDVETSATLSVQFEYDGSSTIAIAFGGYNTDYKVDNLSISTAVPDDGTWAGYTIREDGYVDTAGLLGMIWLQPDSDFIWSVDLHRYLYLPESFVSDNGAWVFVPR